MGRFRFKGTKKRFFGVVLLKLLMGAVLLHYHLSSLQSKSGLKQIVKETVSDLKDLSDGWKDSAKMNFKENSSYKRNDSIKLAKYSSLLTSNLQGRRDTRPKSCQKRDFSQLKNEENSKKLFKTTSIVIMANTEKEKTILASVSSVVNRTDKYFINEILIFVYGNSSISKHFDDFWTNLNTERSFPYLVRYYRERITVSEARNRAVNLIGGKIVVFIHAQSECLIQWLEPLLANLVEHDKRVSVLAADETDWKTREQIEHVPWHLVALPEWSLVEVALHELDFKERKRRNETDPFPDSSPIKTPLFLWSIFATWTQFFKDIGGYDPNLKATYPRSGEDNEFAIRCWLCGGDIYVVPCSKITQSFEPVSENRNVRKEDMDYNMMLMSKFYNVQEHPMFKLWNKNYDHSLLSANDIPAQKEPEMRKCPGMKSFSWYLETLVPEMWNLSTLAAFGTVKLSGHDLCLDAFLGAEPRIYPCHGLTPQRFMYRKDRLQLQSNLRKCLEVASDGVTIAPMTYCDDVTISPATQWDYIRDKNQLINKHFNKCLSVEKTESAAKLVAQECATTDTLAQKWELQSV